MKKIIAVILLITNSFCVLADDRWHPRAFNNHLSNNGAVSKVKKISQQSKADTLIKIFKWHEFSTVLIFKSDREINNLNLRSV